MSRKHTVPDDSDGNKKPLDIRSGDVHSSDHMYPVEADRKRVNKVTSVFIFFFLLTCLNLLFTHRAFIKTLLVPVRPDTFLCPGIDMIMWFLCKCVCLYVSVCLYVCLSVIKLNIAHKIKKKLWASGIKLHSIVDHDAS